MRTMSKLGFFGGLIAIMLATGFLIMVINQYYFKYPDMVKLLSYSLNGIELVAIGILSIVVSWLINQDSERQEEYEEIIEKLNKNWLLDMEKREENE
jgi:hypothetical protein